MPPIDWMLSSSLFLVTYGCSGPYHAFLKVLRSHVFFSVKFQGPGKSGEIIVVLGSPVNYLHDMVLKVL